MAKTVLIVDDSKPVRQLITFLLERAGFYVIAAIHGKDALEKFRESKVDIMITVLTMPEMDGVELIRTVRTTTSQFIPIVILTTGAQEAEKQEAWQAGASGWIKKPFTPAELVGLVNKLAVQGA
ncbi:MAG: response regulator [Thermodesulfovibrionales bacterium]|jgi:two-component system chemotaxis response regulator CheY